MTDFSLGQFPRTRLRRNRQSSWMRDLTAQAVLSPHDLILPLFVIEGKNKEDKSCQTQSIEVCACKGNSNISKMSKQFWMVGWSNN